MAIVTVSQEEIASLVFSIGRGFDLPMGRGTNDVTIMGEVMVSMFKGRDGMAIADEVAERRVSIPLLKLVPASMASEREVSEN